MNSIARGRPFSFTQWEYLVTRDLRRPVFTFLVSGPDLVAPFEPEGPALAARQQAFIADFAKDRAALHYEYTFRATLLDHVRRMDLPLKVSAGRPCNLPEPIGTLFIGRADLMDALRATLAAGETTTICGKQAVHGMDGVGKTRADRLADRKREVHQSCPDGIVWVSCGQHLTRDDLLVLLRDMA
ncbi:MAG: hypothetical protein NTW21_22345 [Verrucomicrobia bacterium]|nr:hypothetical protein [Verrucomicrobiota bacterium]